METFSIGEFFREGGWGMWPTLLLGLAALASAARYATRPDAAGLPFVAALWLTLAVVVAHATLTDVAAVLHGLEDPDRAPDTQFLRMLVIGLKESTRPLALGGIFLTLVPLLMAAGLYRATGAKYSGSSG